MGWKTWTANGRRFKKWIDEGEPPHSLAGVRFTKREEDTTMDNLSEADKANLLIKGLMAHGLSRDQAATVAHRNEVAAKNLIAKNDIDPCTSEREEKLAWLDAESKRLHKLGGLSATQAIDAAQRNWAAQNNSPGQR